MPVMPRGTEQPAGGGQPGECQSRRGDHRMGVENPSQHHVDEEPLDSAFARRQPFVFEITADDAHVVRPIPACSARTPDELQPGGDRARARRAGLAEGQRTSFAHVAEQALVDARHQGLPGVAESIGLRSPRRSCHRMKADAACR